MIEELTIRDLGVIAEAILPLGPGFTAVTGETGAGKTMVVSALGLLLGERADAGAVRQGQAQSWVEGRWVVAEDGPVAERVRLAGGDLDGPELLLGRTVSAEGRSRAIVGGRQAPAAVLAELADHLVIVHGQSEQMRLRSATAQREALDRFAGADFAGVLADYGHAYRRWQANAEELARLQSERDRRSREAEELREALAEIEAVAPQPGEDSELTERAERLNNLEELRQAATIAREQISAEGDGGGIIESPDAVTLMNGARRAVERAAAHDATLGPIAESLASIEFLLADVVGELSSYLDGLDTDGSRELETVQERRAELAALVRKYGSSLDEVIEALEIGSSRLFELDGDAERIAELETAVATDRDLVERLAAELSALRALAAERFAREVTAELGPLAMPNAELSIIVSPRDELGASGGDAVSILLKPHAGADPRPLGRGASGGELSRVMLAIEVVVAGTDPVPTFVFDEVDAGIGGAAAIEIGRRLARLAESAQVIVVTHLAQVAAFAENHLTVVKDRDGSVTASSVQQLRGIEREAEMARLLSGLPDSESGLAHARELIQLAQATRPATL
ncbi:DNA repair protein RecN [Microterricola viridarii]|uniref:DNA repair protein RecN n=1 Tax=Microterricola viridarii TaxID=412690 RepID=A0A1H1WTF5_9MICO|nr:DNA repair protein RecN [Microterricola viridarii]SDT00342.1 DNA replication and repair protein RecN [Microterricola viridarii]